MQILLQVYYWKSREISPAVHEMLDYKNYKFEVLAIEERRISKVKVTVCGKDNE